MVRWLSLFQEFTTMIKAMTLNAPIRNEKSSDRLHTSFQSMHQGEIDLLCCQSIHHSMDGQGSISSLLSETLGLTYSCFAAARPQSAPWPNAKNTVRGLAIFTGNGVWVLNSGSFAVGDADEEEIVQFALIRKNGASVLVLNLHLGVSQQVQARQLHDLFVHPLLKDRYGAVLLCTDRPAALPLKEWKAITARSNYSLYHDPLSSAGSRELLCLLTARTEAIAAVTVRPPEPSPADERLAACPGNILEFEIQRMTSEKPVRLTFPLSFREQWLGYKEHRVFA
jgi:hypothetical protein